MVLPERGVEQVGVVPHENPRTAATEQKRPESFSGNTSLGRRNTGRSAAHFVSLHCAEAVPCGSCTVMYSIRRSRKHNLPCRVMPKFLPEHVAENIMATRSFDGVVRTDYSAFQLFFGHGSSANVKGFPAGT
jgi:hypothetical protein